MIRVGVSGARGRMGRLLVELVQAADDLSLAAALERAGHPDLGLVLEGGVTVVDDAHRAIGESGVWLDFSLPDAVVDHARIASGIDRPVVTGTTGFSATQVDALHQAARRIPLVMGSNMSRGVYVLTRLVEQAAVQLREHDAEIFEIHHNQKADAPSGTALQLARVLRESGGRDSQVYGREGLRERGEVGLASVRGGDVVGEHQVLFLGPGEQLILTHRATSRLHFCRGALEAVRFASGSKPGLYSMADVFGEA